VRSIRLPLRGTALLLTCAALGGCSSAEEDAATSVAKAFVTLGTHPTGKFCDLLSQHIIEQRTRLKGPAAVKKCRARVDKSGARNHGTVPPGLKIGPAKVHGAKADVEASAPGLPTATLHLLKEHGRWKVDSTSG